LFIYDSGYCLRSLPSREGCDRSCGIRTNNRGSSAASRDRSSSRVRSCPAVRDDARTASGDGKEGGIRPGEIPGREWRPSGSVVLLRERTVGHGVSRNIVDEAVSVGLDGAVESGVGRGPRGISTGCHRRGEILEEGQRCRSNSNRTLRVPHVQRIVELLSSSQSI
jgi:hypothetical protein